MNDNQSLGEALPKIIHLTHDDGSTSELIANEEILKGYKVDDVIVQGTKEELVLDLLENIEGSSQQVIKARVTMSATVAAQVAETLAEALFLLGVGAQFTPLFRAGHALLVREEKPGKK